MKAPYTEAGNSMPKESAPHRFIALAIRALLALCAVAIFSCGASAQTTLNLANCSQSALNTEWNLMSSGAYVLQFPSCAAGGAGAWTSQLTEEAHAKAEHAAIYISR